MAIAFLAGCGGGDDEGGGNQIVGPQPDLSDKTPPTITVHQSSIDITGVEKILVSGSELHVGSTLVASWKDNVTKNCKVQLKFDGTAISSGDVPVKS